MAQGAGGELLEMSQGWEGGRPGGGGAGGERGEWSSRFERLD